MTSRPASRLVRPHVVWSRFDFGVAASGLAFLALGVWGLSIAGQAIAADIAIGRDCAQHECTHTGTLVGRQVTRFPGGGTFRSAPTLNYCVLTLDLKVGRLQAAVPDANCNGLNVPSPASADIWHGTVVSVETADGDFGTYANPSNGLATGLFWMIALLPFALCVAMIHYDVLHHPAVQTMNRRFRGNQPR